MTPAELTIIIVLIFLEVMILIGVALRIRQRVAFNFLQPFKANEHVKIIYPSEYALPSLCYEDRDTHAEIQIHHGENHTYTIGAIDWPSHAHYQLMIANAAANLETYEERQKEVLYPYQNETGLPKEYHILSNDSMLTKNLLSEDIVRRIKVIPLGEHLVVELMQKDYKNSTLTIRFDKVTHERVDFKFLLELIIALYYRLKIVNDPHQKSKALLSEFRQAKTKMKEN
ncbi:hypothetical protein H6504_00150 [Candidatus Woesearchaeota archaeon]|nr:hypothetical protein [Candidatus Woesearchaeota archaeon]